MSNIREPSHINDPGLPDVRVGDIWVRRDPPSFVRVNRWMGMYRGAPLVEVQRVDENNVNVEGNYRPSLVRQDSFTDENFRLKERPA